MTTTFSVHEADQAAAYYREHGYSVFTKVFDAATVDAAHAAANRIKDGMVAGSLTTRGYLKCICHEEHDKKQARACWFGAAIEEDLLALARDPNLLAIVQPLLGSTLKQLTNHLHWKPPGTSISVNWHTDRVNRLPESAFRNLGTSFVQTATALDPMTPDNGPLRLVPGSHRRPLHLRGSKGNYSTGDLEDDLLTQAGFTLDDAIAIHAEPGDVVLWHPDTIHGSDVNRSDIDRCIYINGFINAADTWRGAWAWMNGQPVPLPPPEYPVFVQNTADPENWQEVFSNQGEGAS